MGANGGGARGGSKNKKKKKAAKVRADVLLVERGLAAHANEAMALILKRLVVADEGKIIVDKAGSLLPQDVPLRVKGRTGSAAVARAPPASAAGVVLGEEVCGTVVAHHGSRVLVEQDLGEEGAGDDGRRERCSCSLTPALKRVGVVTGDHVRYAPIVEGDESAGMRGVIAARLERKTVLARPTKALADVKEEDLEALGATALLSNMGARKVICANVDQAVFVFAPKPSSTLLLLDSYIVACTESGIRPVIVFNKCDLLLEEGGGDGMAEGEEGVDGAAQERVLGRKVKGGASTGLLGPEFFDVYRELGYTVTETSTRSGAGIEELRQALSGRSSIFIGQSGVGKSSLLNALMPRDVMKVGALSAYSGLGAHTTSHAEMHALPSGGRLIDCAGFRDFEIWHLRYQDIEAGFAEVAAAAGACKFRDCMHRNEPEGVCGVRGAVAQGHIAASRYANFLTLSAPFA